MSHLARREIDILLMMSPPHATGPPTRVSPVILLILPDLLAAKEVKDIQGAIQAEEPNHPQGATPERRVVLLAHERRGQTGLGDSHPLREPVSRRHPLPRSTRSVTMVEHGRR